MTLTRKTKGDATSMNFVGSSRVALLDRLADEVVGVGAGVFVRVGVDGVDGAGKTVFAEELALAVRVRGRVVVHASVDGFHHPPALRYARGRDDPEGFYRDSYDLDALRRELLDPFGPGGDGRHRVRLFDVATESPCPAPRVVAAPVTMLIVDGIFLHRPELRAVWNWSVWLEVERATALKRGVDRDGRGSADPTAACNRRYVEGQRLYMREATPQQHATHVIDNNDLARPVFLR
jgi:uridine kinase